mgnify:CR=1 FL=1
MLGSRSADTLSGVGPPPVRAGDAVVTSGMAEVFPKGLLLGVVRGVERTTAMFLKIAVAPAADFSRLADVFVLTGR